MPDHDATAVVRMREAGAVLVAKLATGELAINDLWFRARTRNPWNPALGSSGSSAGPASAAAAGLVGFAVGTETGGFDHLAGLDLRRGRTAANLRPEFAVRLHDAEVDARQGGRACAHRRGYGTGARSTARSGRQGRDRRGSPIFVGWVDGHQRLEDWLRRARVRGSRGDGIRGRTQRV